MAAGPRRPASCRHQHPDAGRLRRCDRGRAGVDQPARLDLSAARRRCRCLQPRRHLGVRGDLAPSRGATTTSATSSRPPRIGSSRCIGASPMATSIARPWCRGFYAAMRLQMSAWAPLLDTSNVNHGLLLPILLHCRRRSGASAARTATKQGRETRNSLRNAHTDIPAVVEAMRQYWMPTRYARAG